MRALIRITTTTRLFFVLPLLVLAIQGETETASNTHLNSATPSNASQQSAAQPRRISAIKVSGNVFVSEQAILNRIPYIVGEVFNPLKTSALIRNLYTSIGKFKNISLFSEPVGADGMVLHLVVEEKKPLKDFVVEGNKHLPIKDIRTKLLIDDISAIDEDELPRFVIGIKKMYLEKGYNTVDLKASLENDKDGHATARFIVKENNRSLVKRVFFKGNKHISSKELRSNIFTREDWLLSFLDKAGTYHPERIEGDKYIIEQYYQNHGFINAKVYNVTTETDPATKDLSVTFEIEEGDRYTISEVKVRGNDILSDDYLRNFVPLQPGMYYSKEAIVASIKRLESVWGNKGYLFAHIEPSIQPDEDKKTVSVGFYSDPGNTVTLNKITIKGNQKTRDKIIRRRILLSEGDLITNNAMEESKNRVEALGYFDQRDGVIWKTTRLEDNKANLDLVIKEAKTGHFDLKAGFGGSPTDMQSAASGFTVGGSLSETNLFGSGLTVKLDGSWSKDETTANLHIADPWLFDKPIFGAFDLYHRRPTYDNFSHLRAVKENLTGGSLTTGFAHRFPMLEDVQMLTGIGLDNVRRQGDLEFKFASDTDDEEEIAYRTILTKEFAKGTFVWLTGTVESDTRNHPIHPSRGHKWQIFSRVAFNALKDPISFYKLGAEVNWFTPLIGEHDLVFRLHAYAGVTNSLGNKCIPFSELYHVGGPASVRGFLFGQIGPTILGDSVGATKAAFVNAELIFPITQDFNMMGSLFYDGGAGWDAPYSKYLGPDIVHSNSFDYRHSVGVGLRMLSPMPIKIDWGFKLDPRKNRLHPEHNEPLYEVHFGTAYEW